MLLSSSLIFVTYNFVKSIRYGYSPVRVSNPHPRMIVTYNMRLEITILHTIKLIPFENKSINFMTKIY